MSLVVRSKVKMPQAARLDPFKVRAPVQPESERPEARQSTRDTRVLRLHVGRCSLLRRESGLYMASVRCIMAVGGYCRRRQIV